MHDLDRIQMESEADSASEFEDYQTEAFESETDEAAAQSDFESAGGYDTESDFENHGLSEADELELAAELLEVHDDGELDQFLGNLFSKVAKKARGFIKKGTRGALGSLLKGALKTALPSLGNVIAPGLGGLLAGQGASALGSVLGMELEGLSPEDQEFESARQLVRLGGAAVKNALGSNGMAPVQVAQQALTQAARRYAPGLLRQQAAGTTSRMSGRWIRRGDHIVLLGA
jgi:hypothetical protein